MSQDVTAEQIRGIRDVISTSIPFNPLRGDEMDIQNSPLLKAGQRSSAGIAQASADGSRFRSNRAGSFLGRSRTAPMRRC